MLFEKPHERVARSIVREKTKRIIDDIPEIRRYRDAIWRLYAVAPYMKQENLRKAIGEILSASPGEETRVKKKYFLTDGELKYLRRMRSLFLQDPRKAIQKAANAAESHETLKTLAARVETAHKEGKISNVSKRIYVGASDEAILHEIGHALPAAYIHVRKKVPPRAARVIAAIIPIEDDEAFAFAVSHHYTGKNVDGDFFKWVSEAYGAIHGQWNAKRFRDKYEKYRKTLTEKGLDAALREHVGL